MLGGAALVVLSPDARGPRAMTTSTRPRSAWKGPNPGCPTPTPPALHLGVAQWLMPKSRRHTAMALVTITDRWPFAI